MGNLSGKVALVTGASRGIGRYAAQRLARDGARIAVHFGHNEAAARETLTMIKGAGGDAFTVRADLAEPHAAKGLWEAFDAYADHVDIIVNNAGVVVYGDIDEVVEEDFERLYAVNVKAPLFIIQHGLKRMPAGGRIINVSSVGAYAASPMAVMYNGTKGAIDTFTRTLGWDLGERQITVNAVAPGFTDTDMSGWFADPKAKAWAESQSALKRVAQPSDIGDIIAFLASDDARWINGQTIDASGGGVLGVTKMAA